jgi:hypothetical protein
MNPDPAVNHMEASPIPVPREQFHNNHIPQSDGLQTVESLYLSRHAENAPELIGHYKPEAELDPQPAPTEKKRIAGLHPHTFWFIVIITFIVIAAGIGGGVGGAIAVQNSKYVLPHALSNIKGFVDEHRDKNEAQAQSGQANVADAPPPSGTNPPSDTVVPSSTYSTVPGSLYTPVPPSQVQVIDNSCPDGDLKSYDGIRFTCKEKTEVKDRDITGLVAYTLQACIDACAKYNEFRPSSGGGENCGGVVLASSLAHSYATTQGANCWLKTEEAQEELNSSVNGTWAGLCGTSSC